MPVAGRDWGAAARALAATMPVGSIGELRAFLSNREHVCNQLSIIPLAQDGGLCAEVSRMTSVLLAMQADMASMRKEKEDHLLLMQRMEATLAELREENVRLRGDPASQFLPASEDGEDLEELN